MSRLEDVLPSFDDRTDEQEKQVANFQNELCRLVSRAQQINEGNTISIPSVREAVEWLSQLDPVIGSGNKRFLSIQFDRAKSIQRRFSGSASFVILIETVGSRDDLKKLFCKQWEIEFILKIRNEIRNYDQIGKLEETIFAAIITLNQSHGAEGIWNKFAKILESEQLRLEARGLQVGFAISMQAITQADGFDDVVRKAKSTALVLNGKRKDSDAAVVAWAPDGCADNSFSFALTKYEEAERAGHR